MSPPRRRPTLTRLLPHFAAALLAAAAGPARADGAAVGGAGNATCGNYMELAEKDPGRADYVFQSWAQGFISGINFRALQDKSAGGGELIDMNPRDYPPAQQLRFLHSWCALNPGAPVLSAVIALVADLRKTEVLAPKPPQRPPGGGTPPTQ